jgi:hypothetical protein
MTKRARLALLPLLGALLLVSNAQADQFAVYSLKNDVTLAGRPNHIHYHANDFYSVYYLYMSVIRALQVDQHLSHEQIGRVINGMIKLIKDGRAAQLQVPGYPGDGPLRVTVRTDGVKKHPVLMIISNYDHRTGKTVDHGKQNDVYATFFYLVKDKLVKYEYINDRKAALKDAGQSTNNMADYYLLNERSTDDIKGKELLRAGLRTRGTPFDRFMMHLTLMEYYLLESNPLKAKATLDAAQRIMAAEHNRHMRKTMEGIFPYGSDLYRYFMGYENTV